MRRAARHSCWTVADLASPDSESRLFKNPLFLSEHSASFQRSSPRTSQLERTWAATNQPLRAVLERLPAMLGPGVSLKQIEGVEDAGHPARPATAPARAPLRPNEAPRHGISRLIITSLLYGKMILCLPADSAGEEDNSMLNIGDVKRIIYERGVMPLAAAAARCHASHAMARDARSPSSC